jgi:hypothetical protein
MAMMTRNWTAGTPSRTGLSMRRTGSGSAPAGCRLYAGESRLAASLCPRRSPERALAVTGLPRVEAILDRIAAE